MVVPLREGHGAASALIAEFARRVAYDSGFAPSSSQGARSARSGGKPRSRVIAATPSARALTVAGATSVTWSAIVAPQAEEFIGAYLDAETEHIRLTTGVFA